MKKNKDLFDEKVKPHLDDIKRYIRCGVTEGQICEFYGIGKTAWARYKKKIELKEIVFNARQELKTDLINKAYQIANGYYYDETSIVKFKDEKGNVTGSKETTTKKHKVADAGMLQFLLINRFPSEFARDPQVLELKRKALELQEQSQTKTPINLEDV